MKKILFSILILMVFSVSCKGGCGTNKVTADQINEDNVEQQADKIMQELDK